MASNKPGALGAWVRGCRWARPGRGVFGRRRVLWDLERGGGGGVWEHRHVCGAIGWLWG